MIIKPAIIIACLFGISACSAPALMFTGVGGTGAALTKQKSVGSTVDDATIWTKIKAEFLKHHKEIPGIMTNISIEVSEGRVLLTGKVGTPEERIQVLRMVWDQKGVTEVINEIKIPEQEEKTSFKQYINDSWITGHVRSKLIGNHDVHSMNYNIETLNGTVYILGIASTDHELQQVISTAESVPKVEKVIAYVRVADKKIEAIKDSKQPVEDLNQKSNEKPITKRVEYVEPTEDEEIIEIGKNLE